MCWLLPGVQKCSIFYMLNILDDTVLLHETDVDMQKALDATTEYCNDNNMIINASKTKYMVFSRGKIRKTSKIIKKSERLLNDIKNLNRSAAACL